jgi:outer membrane protein assembly factor BamB
VADENGHIHRIKLTNGASFWTLERLGRLRGNIQLRDAIAYIGSLDGALVVVDISTGTLLRRVTVGAPVFASPALSADGIIVADEAGRVHSLLP